MQQQKKDNRDEQKMMNNGQPSTHPQPCKPLLMGWIVDASSQQGMETMARGGDDD